MIKFQTLDDAVRLAEFAHYSQKDKAGLPYIQHPQRVLAAVQAQGAMPYVQIAAILHDVPEDTRISHDVLLSLGFSESVVKLTRLLDRDYSANLWWQVTVMPPTKESLVKSVQDKFYYLNIKNNPDALIIKLADIGDNLQPWRLNYLDDETQKRLRKKYAGALEILNPKPVNHGFISGEQGNPFKPGWY